MFQPGQTVEQQLARLDDALGLAWAEEDWGILNADPARVEEFIAFFEQNYDEHWSVQTVAEFV
ncbi:MAG: hypothetical protein ACRDWY_18385, partial [Actinomycetes bacterium]